MTDDSLLGIWRQMALYETFNQLYLSTLKPLDWSTGDDSSAFLIFMKGKKTYSIGYTGLRIGFVYTIVSRDGKAVIKDRHFFFLTVDAKYNHNWIPMFVLNKFYWLFSNVINLRYFV